MEITDVPSKRSFPIWKTIQLGTVKTVEDFKKVLKKDECHVTSWAIDILNQSTFTVANKFTTINLIKIFVAELGFPDGATRRQIYDRAKEMGIELCPAEVGPQLRLQYKNQPMNEWLRIAMKPIFDSDGGPTVFGVARGDGGLWLRGYCGGPERFWFSGYCLVFSVASEISPWRL